MNHSSATRRIIALDSGCGGLTVVREIRRLLPKVAITYLADFEGFPYGALEERDLVARVGALVACLLDAEPADAVVIACNTASTVVLEPLRRRFAPPFVGIVPAIKTAGALSRSRAIGLLGTPGTIRRDYVDRLIADFAADCAVVRVGSAELAPMAEEKMRGRLPGRARIAEILQPFFDHARPPVDTVVLGCTHYPLLIEDFMAVAPRSIEWLDPAPAVARRLAAVLDGLPASPVEPGERALFTGTAEGVEQVAAFFAELGFESLRPWPAERAVGAA